MQIKELLLTRKVSLTIFPCLESPKDNQLVGLQNLTKKVLIDESGNAKFQNGRNKVSLN
jgi:hypothetical protein